MTITELAGPGSELSRRQGNRVDLNDKVLGLTRYIDDLTPFHDPVYAVPIVSPYSHARVLDIDITEAQALRGFLGILDRDHLDGLDPTIPIGDSASGETNPDERHLQNVRDQGLLTIDKARFDGDLIGIVAATDYEAARRAAQLVRVEYDVLPAVFSFDDALRPGATLVHEDLRDNLAIKHDFEWGDVEAGFQRATHIIEETFFGGNQSQNPMEPSNTCVVNFSGDQVDIWAAVHKPFVVPKQVAAYFGIPPEAVRVRIPTLGGAFGAKRMHPMVIGAVALSRRLRRPVKLVASHADGIRATSRHAIEYKAKVGVDSTGRLIALDVRLQLDTGAYYTGASIVTKNACISAWGCYRIPSFRVHAETAYSNKIPAASFRATGKNQTTFGIECTIDAVAHHLGLSPVEVRRKNVLRRGEMIAESWKVNGREYRVETPPIDTDYETLLDAAVANLDGSRTQEMPPPSVRRGRGVALSLRHGAQGGGRAYAMVSLDHRGRLTVHHNAPDFGGGVFNVLAVIVAEEMGVQPGDVHINLPDTANNMPFGGTSAQRTSVQMGNAVRAACDELKAEIVRVGSQVLGAGADVRVADGRIWSGDNSWSFEDVLRRYKGEISLRGVGAYSYAPTGDRAFGGLDHWAPGAAAAEVEVDVETGEVRVIDYVAVADVGHAIHRASVVGQMVGGATLGLGGTLFEELVYEDGELLNGDPFQYRLPGHADMPRFKTVIIENHDGPGPYGAKGMAQTSLPCVAPAIANAIRDATGVVPRRTPITPESMLRELGSLDKLRDIRRKGRAGG